MIDDLVTLGTQEPYRMFTSRAEYRLFLRADNADLRLTDKGTAAGIVGATRARAFAAKKTALAQAREKLDAIHASPQELRRAGFDINLDGVRRHGMDLLAFPSIDFASLAATFPGLDGIRPDIAEQLEIEATYAGYLERQDADVRAMRRDEGLALPADIDYGAIASLSKEVQIKLSQVRPETIGQAARISGVTPAAITALLAHVKKRDTRLSA
jgi:tRNA uridine 5-carboxymethylaminomethyl modification enzyme